MGGLWFVPRLDDGDCTLVLLHPGVQIGTNSIWGGTPVQESRQLAQIIDVALFVCL